jgi:hypothetical protein
MIKLTKKLLNENRIYNPHGIATATGEKLFIGYRPAAYGRIYESAHWKVVGITFYTDPNAAWYDHKCKTFSFVGRENKEPTLTEAKTWVKQHYNLDITERDAWGNWHVTGTMDKLREIISKNK